MNWEALGAIGTCIEAIALGAIFVWDRIDAGQQHEQTLKQFKASKDAADAALLNAKAVIAVERPWIVVIPKRSTIMEFSFDVINKGRTPAKIESVTFNWTFDSYHDKSRTPPNHLTKVYALRDFIEQNGGFNIPISKNPLQTIAEAGLVERANKGNQFLIYDGKVTYWDAFDVEGTKQVLHETVWSYFFDFQTKDLVRIGEYSRYT
jgi:hypothetical protein